MLTIENIKCEVGFFYFLARCKYKRVYTKDKHIAYSINTKARKTSIGLECSCFCDDISCLGSSWHVLMRTTTPKKNETDLLPAQIIPSLLVVRNISRRIIYLLTGRQITMIWIHFSTHSHRMQIAHALYFQQVFDPCGDQIHSGETYDELLPSLIFIGS